MRGVALVGSWLLAGCIPGGEAPFADAPVPLFTAPVPIAAPQIEPDHQPRHGDEEIEALPAPRPAWEGRPITANALVDPCILRVGQRVGVPGEERGSPSLAERAAAFTLDVDDILTGGEPALASNQAPAVSVATPARVLPATAAVLAPARLRTGFAWPVDGRVVMRFGRGRSGERNDSIKIAVPTDTPIKAAADGVVAYGGVASLGGLVIVEHGESWTSVYGHASKLLVRRGQSVKRDARAVGRQRASGPADAAFRTQARPYAGRSAGAFAENMSAG